MHSVYHCNLLVWRSFLKKGTPVTYFCPALDPPMGGSGRKTTTLVRDHELFMHTKFHQNPSSGSGEEVENVKVYGRRRTDDGRCAMKIAHLSLRLRYAKKYGVINNKITMSINFKHGKNDALKTLRQYTLCRKRTKHEYSDHWFVKFFGKSELCSWNVELIQLL